jgi:hypothetical protein
MRTDLPLEAATQDVIARYKRGNDMLASAAVALRRLKERVEAGEANGMDWHSYRHAHLEQHVTRSWINRQLALAPPGATEETVAENVTARREDRTEKERARRELLTKNGTHVGAAPNQVAPVSVAKSDPINYPIEELVAEFNALSRRNQNEFLSRIGAVRSVIRTAQPIGEWA